jgi:tetratricopeptide (TPR) repeat protein
LAYCQRSAGDAGAADATQARAQARLAADLDKSKTIEVPFYLVNTYQNLGNSAELVRVAGLATQRYERGELGTATSSADMFRLAKLYADLGNEAQALAWHARSIDAQTAEGHTLPSYLRWSSRYLAEAKFRSKDFAAAGRYYSVLFQAGDANVVDLDRWASASVRTGKFQDAADAWKQAEILNPAEDDRWRYSQRVALLALDSGDLPGVSPAGKAWPELTREELETLMHEQAERVKAAVAEGSVEGAPVTPERRAALEAEIKDARGPFTAAALEYTVRGLPIRETAFFGGYAPLLFRKGAWQLPHERRKRNPGDPPRHAPGLSVDTP